MERVQKLGCTATSDDQKKDHDALRAVKEEELRESLGEISTPGTVGYRRKREYGRISQFTFRWPTESRARVSSVEHGS